MKYIEQIEDFSAISEIQLEETRKAKDKNNKLVEKLNNQLKNLENKEKKFLVPMLSIN